jgi:hypothetical protein
VDNPDKNVAIEISSVPPEQVNLVWAHSRNLIMKALSKGQADASSESEYLEELSDGNMQMWVVHSASDVKAVVVVSIVDFGKIKKVMVNLIAGDGMPQWSDLVKQTLLDLKDMVGASCVEASCRLGLAKFLTGEGWSKKAIIMELK